MSSLTLLAACAGSPGPSPAELAARGQLSAAVHAYAIRAPDEDPRDALAEAVLLRAAKSPSPDEQDAAFAALASLGARAQPLLQRLLVPGTDAPEATKIRALSWLGQHGDVAAMRTLRQVFSGLAVELKHWAVPALSPSEDGQRLRALLVDPDAALRASACLAYQLHPEPRVDGPLLLERMRLDPDMAVRRAALPAALAHADVPSDVLVELASAPDQPLAAAALRALAERGVPEQEALFRGLLLSDPTFLGIEAARLLLVVGDAAHREIAQGLIVRALSSPDVALRAQAAVALRSLPRSESAKLMPADAMSEPDVTVRLQLALSMLPAASAVTALLSLVHGDNERVALEAAVTLADMGRPVGRKRLCHAKGSTREASRARAARALAAELAMPDAVVPLLADPSPRVRCIAAAALLGPRRAGRAPR